MITLQVTLSACFWQNWDPESSYFPALFNLTGMK